MTFDGSLQTEAQRAFLRECFAFANPQKRSTLDLKELKCAVAAALGIRASKLVLAQMFSHELTKNTTANAGNGIHSNYVVVATPIECIQVAESVFIEAMLPRMHKHDILEQVRRSFKAFDLRSQGFISFESFQKACTSVLPLMPERTMFEIFREADRDADGRVTYNDFEAIYLLAEEANLLSIAPQATQQQRRRHRIR